MTDRRKEALALWAGQRLGVKDKIIAPASADASFRRYFRIETEDASYILMDAPPAQEDSAPFVRISELLCEWGLHAPEVLASDMDRGFLLLSDLGSQTYLDALQANESSADRLYADAIAALVSMQRHAQNDARCAALPPYGEKLLRDEMALFCDWLLYRHLGIQLSDKDRKHWHQLQDVLVASARAQPQIFVHRDYHSRNLMTAPPTPGILDFQDAVIGPLTYDLVSLIKDCYVAWPAQKIDTWLQAYATLAVQAGLLSAADEVSLAGWFNLMGVQRHLKASGIFARLNHRDGKTGYMADIPRTLNYIIDAGQSDQRLTWLCELIGQRVMPLLQEDTA